MNAVDYQILRQGILLAVGALGSHGLTAEAIGLHCRARGFELTVGELAVQLGYLLDKGLLCERAAVLSAGLKRYALSALGRGHLEAQGLL